MSEAIQKKAIKLEKDIKAAELDVGRTKHESNWHNDANLRHVRDRAAHVKKLEAKLAKLRERYRKLDEEHVRNSGGTRRRRGIRKTRSTARRRHR